MDRENKITLAYRVALVSGAFCGIVALLLILNFWHMKQHKPLESKTIEALVRRLSEEPDNEELQEEIRSFDLLARKAYFTSQWQVKTGTWLLLIGGIVFAVSLKVHTDLRARIVPPETVTEEILKARANAQYWLFMGGGLILGFALVAAYLSNDFLRDYRQMAVDGTAVSAEEGVEVVRVFPGGTAAGEQGGGALPDSSDASAAMVRDAGEPVPAAGESQSGRAPSGEGAARGEVRTAERSAAGFNREDFKRNHATFRGYMGQGVSYSKNIPVEWNGPSGEHIKWKVTFSKPGFNSPVIWDDRLFISGADASARIVACYNRNTGQLLWEQQVTGIPGSPASMPKVSDDTGLAAPTMAVDGKRVYAIFATGDVVAYDLEGKKVWGRNLGVPNNHYGHASSLQVWENKLVVQYDTNTGGRMLALDTATGETLWDVQRPVHISWSSPTLIEVDGKIEVVTSADPYVSGNDLQTGRELWKVEAMMGEVAPSVAYDDGLVFATNEYARLVALEPKPDAGYVWEDDEYLAEVSSPVARGGLLYVATSYGVLVCYDAKTGEKYWEKEFSNGFYSSPMIAEGKLYVIDVHGVTHILKADKTGTVLAEPELGEPVYTLPVFEDGVLYLRGVKNLYCIDK
jgi:outer membrane protein assembly factor BamB